MSLMRRTVLLALFSLLLPLAGQQPTCPAITGVAFARFYTTNPEGAACSTATPWAPTVRTTRASGSTR